MSATSANGLPAVEATERVVFASTMEAAFTALTPLRPDEERLFTALGVKRGVFRPAYALHDYTRIIDVASKRFAPLPEFERYTLLGRLFFSAYAQTLVGRSLLLLLGLLGPDRMLQRMSRNLRTANNYSTVEVEPLGPRRAVMHMNYVERPGFYAGVVEAALLATGAKHAQAELVSYRDFAATYEIRWE